jgi:hypothetical protein
LDDLWMRHIYCCAVQPQNGRRRAKESRENLAMRIRASGS